MKLATAEAMRALDRRAIDEYGIPSLVLMENAGRGVAQAALDMLGEKSAGKRVLVFCGKGNNGGDGFVAARHLYNAGVEAKTFLLAPRAEIPGDALVNLNILEKMGVRITEISQPADIQRTEISLLYADLVIDAIFGTGFSGKAAGMGANVIDLLNKSGKPVLSIDLPSGMEADTGRIPGACVRAARTCTLGVPKLGLFLFPASSYAGEVTLVDISLPVGLVEDADLPHSLITEETCAEFFPVRNPLGHKGSYGHVFVVGGSEGMTGAVILAARAALKGGAGLVTACVPSSLNDALEASLTEVMTLAVAETSDRVISEEALKVFDEKLKQASVVAAGPGLSRNPAAVAFLQGLLPRLRVPAVVDADGLNALAQDTKVFSRVKCPLVITPHPGEMGRLLGCSTSQVQADRIGTALQAAKKWSVTAVLKGANTVVATPEGRIFLNITGNPGLATGGTGDVLTGLIAGFLAQGMSPEEAAAAGVYVHGRAADSLLKNTGTRGMTAGDIVEGIPGIIRGLEENYARWNT